MIPRPRANLLIYHGPSRACPDCGGRLHLVATIEERGLVQKILSHLGLPVDLPSPAPACSPEWLFGQAAGTGRQWPD